MRIGELSEKSGISKSMIHFYLKENILHVPIKTSRTMSYYDESHIKRLEDIKRLKMDMRMPTHFLKKQLAELDKKRKTEGNTIEKSMQDISSFQHPKEIRKKQITEAGIKIFTEKGYHSTRVLDITNLLGISTGTFYLYFKNKQDLFLSVVNDVIKRIVGAAASAIKKETDYLTKLYIRGKIFFDNNSNYLEILSILRGESPSEDQWARDTLQKIYQELTEPIIEEARKAIADGQISPDMDPELLAYHLIGVVETMSFRATLDQKYDYEAIWKNSQSIYLNGFVVKR